MINCCNPSKLSTYTSRYSSLFYRLPQDYLNPIKHSSSGRDEQLAEKFAKMEEQRETVLKQSVNNVLKMIGVQDLTQLNKLLTTPISGFEDFREFKKPTYSDDPTSLKDCDCSPEPKEPKIQTKMLSAMSQKLIH